MEYKEIKGVKIPVLGMGTMNFGGTWNKKDSSSDEKDVSSIRNAIEAGITHIDTAEIYSEGHSEELIGKAIDGFDRLKLFITTKVWKENLRYDSVLAAAKGSLERMGIEYIDLYLVHAPSENGVPISETMKAMDKLVEDGVVKNIGVSNFSVDQIKEAQSVCKNKIICNQIEYNLLARNNGKHMEKMESEIIPHCQKNDMFVTAYSPLAKGLLARKGLNILDNIAAKYGKTQSQIALKWIISKKNLVAIVKAGNVEHIKDNLGCFGWELDEEDIKKLDEFPI